MGIRTVTTMSAASLSPWAIGVGMLLLALLGMPIVALVSSASVPSILQGIQHPMFAPALALSLRTTATSVVLIVTMGTPLAYWLAHSTSTRAKVVEALLDLPVIMPPAVVGVALLQAYGYRGWLGPTLDGLGLRVSFSEVAVILAQIAVSAPFFVQAANNAFRQVDADTLFVARTLGASRTAALFRIAIPVALPGLLNGAALCWARALGEFGATLLFAGNMPGKTQTMPLAIFTALEADVELAVVFSIVLSAVALLLLLLVRSWPRVLRPWRLRSQTPTTTAAGGTAAELPPESR